MHGEALYARKEEEARGVPDAVMLAGSEHGPNINVNNLCWLCSRASLPQFWKAIKEIKTDPSVRGAKRNPHSCCDLGDVDSCCSDLLLSFCAAAPLDVQKMAAWMQHPSIGPVSSLLFR